MISVAEAPVSGAPPPGGPAAIVAAAPAAPPPAPPAAEDPRPWQYRSQWRRAAIEEGVRSVS